MPEATARGPIKARVCSGYEPGFRFFYFRPRRPRAFLGSGCSPVPEPMPWDLRTDTSHSHFGILVLESPHVTTKQFSLSDCRSQLALPFESVEKSTLPRHVLDRPPLNAFAWCGPCSNNLTSPKTIPDGESRLPPFARGATKPKNIYQKRCDGDDTEPAGESRCKQGR